MKKITLVLTVIAMTLCLFGCNEKSKAKGNISEDNGISSSIDVEVGN